MIWLRSLLFNVAFWCWTIVLGLLASPLLISARLARPVPDIWIDVTLWLLRVLCGLRIQIRGAEHLPQTPCVIAAKHQSALDTLVLWRILGGPAFILKRQLLHIPIFGWYLARMQPIAIERANRAEALQKIGEQAVQKQTQGRHIVIFPEGTRTKPGSTVRYRTGGITLLYRTLNCPIVPVALNTGVFWARNAFLKKPGVVTIEFLPLIAAGQDENAMLQQLQRQIESASDVLIRL